MACLCRRMMLPSDSMGQCLLFTTDNGLANEKMTTVISLSSTQVPFLSLQSLAYLSFVEVALEVRGAHPWCVHIASSLIANQPVQHKGLPQLPDPILQRSLGKGERSCSSSLSAVITLQVLEISESSMLGSLKPSTWLL